MPNGYSTAADGLTFSGAVLMHLSAMSRRLRVVRTSGLPGGISGRYNLDRGVIELDDKIVPTECPRVAAEVIVTAEVAAAFPELSTHQQDRLAIRMASVMAQFVEDIEQAGGRMAFFRAETAGMSPKQKAKWMGMTNGSVPAGRPCACPTCDTPCAPGSVEHGEAIDIDGTSACQIVTDCEWCGPWSYYELANGAGKPSGQMLGELEPQPLTDEALREFQKRRRGVAGTIYL